MQANELLKLMVDNDASDLHLKISNPPILRVDGVLKLKQDLPPLTARDIESLFEQLTTPEQRDSFVKEQRLDFAYSIAGLSRFRINALLQKSSIGLAFRMVPYKIPSIDELGLPSICKKLILKPRGLILVTGPTGSGKSTTLAAMIDYLNENEGRHVITVEDPIEFLHQDKKCIITQQEVGSDTKSFSSALVNALRHDPDVILIGEMRDLATTSTAITAAETGHLVLGTLHTSDAVQTIDRIVDIFPPEQQRQIRLQLSQVLVAILSQALLPRIRGGRIGAFEIMIATHAIRSLIREEKTHELYSVMQLGANDFMQTMTQALADLVRRDIVTQEEALAKSSDPKQLYELLEGVVFSHRKVSAAY